MEPVIRPACLTPECRGDQHARGLCKTCLATFYRHRTPAIESQMIAEGWILPRKPAGRKPGPMAEAMKLANIPQAN